MLPVVTITPVQLPEVLLRVATVRPVHVWVRPVAGLRDLPPAEVSVADLRLVRLYRDGRNYQWDTVAVVPLGA
ncbi:hypothetical protein [Pseudofrankia sp. BMG5.36]|uniref:hypothetical protein n=1 Tax=Pseudofrankia sp. BMG5.36 TaxID=1834512 RepID=UPI0008D99182|nr:hypothetical protein [Pseudofrankia sp. BMG5.36]OHV57161.1 hypothetical protein BCD48_43395 [Pseudofrankia sp. BMG5.36]